MRIKKLSVKNFRCFGTPQQEVTFEEGNYFVVVGPNGVGKSNLIEAIRWATGHRQIYGDFADVPDFHNCVTKESVDIYVELEQPIRKGNTFRKIQEVCFLACSIREYSKTDQKGDIHAISFALDKDRKQILRNLTIPKPKGKEYTEEEKEAMLKPIPMSARDVRDQVLVFFLDPTNYDFNLSMRRGSLLSTLSQVLGADLMREDAMAEYKGEQRKRREVIQELSDEITSILQSERGRDVLGRATDFMSEQMELPKDALGLELTLPQGSELLSRLSLLARDGSGAPQIPLEKCGKGYSALAVVGLFGALTLAKAEEKYVLLIEEPESFLAPTVRAAFASQLRAFAEAGNQVIVVTHAPEFVEPTNPAEIIRLTKEGGQTRIVQWPSTATAPTFDKSLKFVEPNLGKLLFARRLLFVEGDDDVAAIRSALELCSVDPAFHGLEIIRMNGKNNAKTFHEYVSHFRIEHAFLLDGDAKSVLENFDSSGTYWSLLEPDLEKSMNTTKKSRDNSAHVYSIVQALGSQAKLASDAPAFYRGLKAALGKVRVTLP